MSEPPERRTPTVPISAEGNPLPRTSRSEGRLVGAWHEWLRALATDAEAALAAAIAYQELDAAGRNEWLTALDQDMDQVPVPKFAVYAPLLAVESDPERRARIQRAVGPLDPTPARAVAHGYQGTLARGVRLAVLVSPLYLDFVQVLACAYRPDVGFEWVRHDPIVERRRAPTAGAEIEGARIEAIAMRELIDELSHAVLAQQRSGQDLPEALRIFADLFSPEPSGSWPVVSEC
ncbi:MAG TPA: hypothetical protein VFQ61_27530 [Polyangiaceae bacterium]|nr:hypothetical protein [Polyangiaceae bacterium]